MKKFFNPLASAFMTVLVLFSLSVNVHAQNLAVWNFDGEVNSPSFTEIHVLANNAAFGSNVTSISYPAGNGSPDSYSGTPWPTTPVVNENSYLEFTIAPQAGFMMSLTGFNFQHRRSGTGIRAWELRTSLDAYATPVASAVVPDVDSWHTVAATLPSGMVDLTGPVTFRIFGFNAEASAGTWRFDNIEIAGTVAEIPPPVPISNWALVIGVLLIASSLIIRYRRPG